MKLDLSVEQINLILAALGNAQFNQVAPLIAEIHRQAGPQVEAPPSEIKE